MKFFTPGLPLIISTFTETECMTITFIKNKIYQHKVMQVNYTTYDMIREQDSLNPWTHTNIMVLSQERSQMHIHTGMPALLGYTTPWFDTTAHLTQSQLNSSSFTGMASTLITQAALVGKCSGYLKLDLFLIIQKLDLHHSGFWILCRSSGGAHLIPSFTEGQTGDLLEPLFACLEHEGDYD